MQHLMPTRALHHGKVDWCLGIALVLLLATAAWIAVGLGLGYVRFDFWQFDPTSWTTPLALFLFLLVICIFLVHRFLGLLSEYNDAVVAHADRAQAIRLDKEAELSAREEESERLRKLLEFNVFALQTNERVIAEAHQKLTDTIVDFEGMAKFVEDVEHRASQILEESSCHDQVTNELKAEHVQICGAVAIQQAEMAHHIAAVRDARRLPAVSESHDPSGKETLRMAAHANSDNLGIFCPAVGEADFNTLEEQNFALALVLRDQEADVLATQRQLSLLQHEYDWVSEQLAKESGKVSKLESRAQRYEARLQIFKQMQRMVQESHSMLQNCQDDIAKEHTAQAWTQERLEQEEARSRFLVQLLKSLKGQLQKDTLGTNTDANKASSANALLTLAHSLDNQETTELAVKPSTSAADVAATTQSDANAEETHPNADQHVGVEGSSGSEQGSSHTGDAAAV
eukprot:gnl/MRDRNA2_/MRDRNA2_106118_c0_seq1.p1 gnl/MRDRNA2_/MRDRNA2_106118_c0~~gnl/MRDRNA2_/MRDRNA2_106118_c0_seq1.p1  ORF type:complete len:457 (+),score=98.14 gnl/MRDRNA2_/MRDRNA2_106118_c0_seq1:64-1434(+)